MTPERGCGEDAGGIPCPHVLVSFALPPAVLFVSSDTDLFHPTPWGLDRSYYLFLQNLALPFINYVTLGKLFISFCLNSLICKMRIRIVPPVWLVRRLNELINIYKALKTMPNT